MKGLIFTDRKTNLSRQWEFDYAKAAAIVFMVAIHVYEQLSSVDEEVLCTSVYDNVLQFAAGPLAAPVFMTALGVGIIYSSHNAPGQLIRRGLHIFLLGYLLNFLRGGIPMIAHTGSVLNDDSLYTLLNVDILPFAGLAFMLTGVLKKLKVPVLMIGVIAVLLQCLGQALSGWFTFDTVAGSGVMGLFFSTGEIAYFSLMNWFVYPAAGILLGTVLQHTTDKARFYKAAALISGTFLIAYCLTLKGFGIDLRTFYALAGGIYYAQGFLHLLFTVPVMLLWFALFYWVSRKVTAPFVTKWVKYLSNDLNRIYMVQWVLIGWSDIPIVLEWIPEVAPTLVVPIGLGYLVLTIAILKGYDRIRKVKRRKTV